MVHRKSTPKNVAFPKRKKPTQIFQVGNRQYHVSRKIMNEIKVLQTTTIKCIAKLPFSRLIREKLQEHSPSNWRVQVKALEALQEAAEMYLTQLFEDANRCAMHARRITLRPNDIHLALAIRRYLDPGFQH